MLTLSAITLHLGAVRYYQGEGHCDSRPADAELESVRIHPPLSDDTVDKLAIGDRVLISGVIYSARDAA